MDFSTAICDATGEMVGQGVTLPNQLGAIPDAVGRRSGRVGRLRDPRRARDAGAGDWLYPNSPSLALEPGGHQLRFTALDETGTPIDEDATVRVYTRARPVEHGPSRTP